MKEIEELFNLINSSNKIVFFGGAGVSTESGIPDFRSANGIYNSDYGTTVPPEVIISHSYFIQNTKSFYEFYKKHLVYQNAKPNMAHKYLAHLEEENKLLAIITQNIDGLHQMAGSKNVVELHGSVKNNKCLNCGKQFDLNYIMGTDGIPICDKCGGIIKPIVTLYEESLSQNAMANTIKFLHQADLLIVAGTSLTVYPAASFIDYFSGNNKVLINKTNTSMDESADIVLREPVGKIFEKLYKMEGN